MADDERTAKRKAYMKQYYRERVELLHVLKLCTRCKQQDAFTLAGRSWCADCVEKQNDKRRKQYHAEYEARLKRDNETHQRLYWRRREQGLCTQCGKPSDGVYLCATCQVKVNKKRRERAHKRGVVPMELRGKDGYCFQCLTEPVAEGTKLCAGCLEKIRKMVLSRPHQDNAGHFWRLYNRAVFKNSDR